MAWRKIPIPTNIDVVLIEQDVVGNDRTVLEAVILANEKLVKLGQDVQWLQDFFMEDGMDDEMDNGETFVDFYKKIQEIGSNTAGEQV